MKNKRPVVVTVGILVIVVFALLWIVKTQPFMGIEKLSLLEGADSEVKTSYLFAGNYFKAVGYSQRGHIYPSKFTELDVPQGMEEKPLMLSTLYGFKKSERRDEANYYLMDYKNFSSAEEAHEIEGLKVMTKTGEQDGVYRSVSAFEKGEAKYLVEFLSKEKGDEELFKKNVQLLLKKLLSQ